MVKRLYSFLIMMILLYGCTSKQSANKLYLDFIGKEVPVCFENFEGMGKEVFPDFLSWGVFKYTASYKCIENEYLKDTIFQFSDTLKDGTIIQDKKFEINECKYFPKDLSFYKNTIDKGFIDAKYDCDNKIFIHGIKYPYMHDILYDTISHNTVHLVTTIRE